MMHSVFLSHLPEFNGQIDEDMVPSYQCRIQTSPKEIGMSDIVFETLPGGFTLITGGGTRKEVNLSRPWQTPIAITPISCPFCAKKLDELPVALAPDGWRVINNISTRHRRARIVIPDHCWEAQKLQCLGGIAQVQGALETVRL